MTDPRDVQLPLPDNDPDTIDIVIGSGDCEDVYGYRELRMRFPSDITCTDFVNNICRTMALSVGFVETSFNQALADLGREYAANEAETELFTESPLAATCPCGTFILSTL